MPIVTPASFSPELLTTMRFGARRCRKTDRPLASDTRDEGEDGPAYRSDGF